VAMVLSIAGNCLILTIFGLLTIIAPVIGRLYLVGQPGQYVVTGHISFS
jgi:hypothetical protein